MAKKNSKKMDTMALVLTVVILALAVLTVCTLFMPVFKQWGTATKIETWTANGADVFKAAFAGELSTDMTAGTAALYGLKAAEDTAFVATVGYWLYMLMVLVSVAVIVFAVLSMIGLRFKLVNTILGGCLAVLAILTFIFALVIAGKFSSDGKVGFTCAAQIGTYLGCIGALICGGATVYKARA